MPLDKAGIDELGALPPPCTFLGGQRSGLPALPDTRGWLCPGTRRSSGPIWG